MSDVIILGTLRQNTTLFVLLQHTLWPEHILAGFSYHHSRIRVAAGDTRQAIGASDWGVVDVPSAQIALSPVESPVAATLQVGRQLFASRPVCDAALVITPAGD